MRPGLVLAIAVATSACLTPRSMMQGQMAAPLGRGAVDIGIGTGIGYAQQTTTRPGTTNEAAGARVWSVPALEGNAHFGVNDHIGVNAHFSPAGIQPGLKITVNRPKAAAHFALMPQFAIGYAHVRSASYITDSGGVQTEAFPVATSMLTFMLGLRLMVSHQSGFYAGLGYDFIATRSVSNSTVGAGNTSQPTYAVDNTLQMSIAANVGFSLSLGWLRIRPELSFAIQPWLESGRNSEAGGFGASGGFGWALLPGFSLAAVTPKNTKDTGAEEDEKNVGPSDDGAPPNEEREDKEEREDREERQERDE